MTVAAVQFGQLLLALWAAAEWLWTLNQRRSIDRFGWCLPAAAVSCWTVGDAIRLAPLLLGHTIHPATAVSNVLSAAWALLCALVGWRIAARQSRNSRIRFWLDGTMITSALLVVSWAILLPPATPGNGDLRYATFSRGMADVFMVSGLLMLCSRLPWLRSGTVLSMIVGQSAIAGGDVIDLLAQQHGPHRVPPLGAELSWLVGLAVIALNARRLRHVPLPSTTPVPQLTPDHPVGPVSVALPYVPLVAVLAFAIARAATHTPWVLAETWFSIVATVVVAARQLLVLYDNRRLLLAVGQRERLTRDHALHDPLTGLANRTLFSERLDAAVSSLPAASELAILFCDLDDFKRVNDHLGHSAGDQLLQVTARRLEECVPGAAIVARLGGDEFAVLLTGPAESAGLLAARIMKAFAAPMDVDGEPLLVVVSIGIGLAQAGTVCTAQELLTQADLAMLTAKRQGKGRYATYDPAMKPADLRDRGLVNDFSAALREGQLSAVYQPIVELCSGRIVGLEALARWDHPQRGEVPPDRFIKLAEATGLIGALTELILRRTAADHARWRAGSANPAEVPFVSVNVSANVLLRHDFAAALSAVEQAGLPPGSLVLELTDSHAVPDEPQVESLMDGLRLQGVRLALDDFGVGHHVLTNLRRLPIDIIKIDRSIVSAAAASSRDNALLGSYVAIGRALHASVIAQGVETPEQAARLAELGCRWGQGYLFSPPLSADEVLQRLDRQHASVAAVPAPRQDTASAAAAGNP